MNTIKDYLEVIYWLISLVILIVTVYWIKVGPLKAVQIDRLLNNEQNKYDVKTNLFLKLYSLRGNPGHHEFVTELNKIDIVFSDNQKVLDAWELLHKAYHSGSDTEWGTLRVELLSIMGQSLGYPELNTLSILRTYHPIIQMEIFDLQKRQLDFSTDFFESGDRLNKALLANLEDNGKVS